MEPRVCDLVFGGQFEEESRLELIAQKSNEESEEFFMRMQPE